MGSPICAVREEKFGSSRVHCKSVPAGKTCEICAAALSMRHRIKIRSKNLLSILTSSRSDNERSGRRGLEREPRSYDASRSGISHPRRDEFTEFVEKPPELN